MALTAVEVKAATADGKARKLFDGKGLFLLVTGGGSRLWRLKYRYGGKEKLLALGSFPEVGLKEARAKREEARRLMAEGVDPGAARKAQKGSRSGEVEASFEAVGREWFAKWEPSWAPGHSSKLIRRLERFAFPWIGGRPVDEIQPREVLELLQRIEARGTLETAHRVRQACGQIFRYAVATGRAHADPTGPLKGAIAPARAVHRASITKPSEVGALLRAIDGYTGSPTVGAALRLAPLLFVRPGELRGAQWREIDLAARVWKIPEERMKMKSPHIVPLSRQAVAIFEEIKPLTGGGRLVFPGERSVERPISDNSLNAALRRMGYGKHEMTAHGFRSMASTLLNENGKNRDVIERQLAHSERDGVRAAYNYADYLDQRREMMQWWADYLDELRDGREIPGRA